MRRMMLVALLVAGCGSESGVCPDGARFQTQETAAGGYVEECLLRVRPGPDDPFDPAEVHHGPWREYDADGQLEVLKEFDRGVPVGLARHYDDAGLLWLAQCRSAGGDMMWEMCSREAPCDEADVLARECPST